MLAQHALGAHRRPQAISTPEHSWYIRRITASTTVLSATAVLESSGSCSTREPSSGQLPAPGSAGCSRVPARPVAVPRPPRPPFYAAGTEAAGTHSRDGAARRSSRPRACLFGRTLVPQRLPRQQQLHPRRDRHRYHRRRVRRTGSNRHPSRRCRLVSLRGSSRTAPRTGRSSWTSMPHASVRPSMPEPFARAAPALRTEGFFRDL